MQSDFVSHLQASMTSGIGRLVDADMEEESARLAAQQTQQQLAVQALQIANTTPGTILQLYSGR
jgi:flagellin-like hook-associated protein FlgL